MTVALVLGAAVRADGTASPTLRLRVDHAYDLFHAGRCDAICIAGGIGRHGPAEAIVGRALALVRGVPAHLIVTETLSRTTVENIAFAKPLLAGHAVVIVSNRWHLPRALLAARLLGLSASGSGPRGTAGMARTVQAILREAAAMPITVLRALLSGRRGSR